MQELTKISSRLERQIADKDSRCLNRFPMEDYTGAVERWPESLPYHYGCPEIREIDARIIADHGPGRGVQARRAVYWHSFLLTGRQDAAGGSHRR